MYAPPVPPKKSGSGWKLFAAAVALVAMGAGVGSATTWALGKQFEKNSLPIGYVQPSSLQKVSAVTGSEAAASVVPGIWQRLSPSVVRIDTTTTRGPYRGAGTGSGFVVDPAGYIMTNRHVIEGATSIKVKFVDGTVLDGKVVGSDQYKDVAIVKVDPGTRTLIAAPLGDSSKVQVGELAVAIGSPFGQEFTVTAGIISAVNRTLNETNSDNPIYAIPGGLQTDAAINPGNSGGPLLNAAGEVIGINTLIETGDTGVSGNMGIGFAVPINLAKDLMPNLMAGKSTAPAYLGVSMQDMSAAIAKQLGVDYKDGAVITQIASGTPAEKAGLQEPVRMGKVTTADVIVAVDGKAMKSTTDVQAAIAAHKPGDKITITVMRGAEKVDVTATLDARPDDL
jgi:S1-C subfamily serine protease